jgi:hypothetical protein
MSKVSWDLLTARLENLRMLNREVGLTGDAHCSQSLTAFDADIHYAGGYFAVGVNGYVNGLM